MKISVLLISASCLLSIGASAQTKPFNISVGPDAGFPVGDFRDTHSFGIGASAVLYVPITSKYAGTLSAGYAHYFARAIPGTGDKYKGANIIPVRIGTRYSLGINTYASAQLGYGSVGMGGDQHGGVSYAFGLGTFNGRVDLAAAYEHIAVLNGVSMLGIHLGYVISVGNSSRTYAY